MSGTRHKPERYLYMLPEEFHKFIVAAYEWDIVQGMLWDITGNGGFRISETLLLRPMDFNWEESTIYVTTLKQKSAGSLYGFKPKSSSLNLDLVREHMDPTKTIVIPIMIPKRTLEICKKIIDSLNLRPDEHIFKIQRIWAWRCFKKILTRAGLSPLYSPHALRHCQGIMAAEVFKGNPIKIAKRMRHKNPNNIFRYVHLLKTDEKEMVKYLEEQQANKGKNPKEEKTDGEKI